MKNKIAIGRVLSDIIRGEGNLSPETLDEGFKILTEYGVSFDDEAEGRNITFTDALRMLQDMSVEEKKAFIQKLSTVNTKRHLLLTAVDAVLLHDAMTFTVPLGSYSTNYHETLEWGKGPEQKGSCMLYMEDEYDETINAELQDDGNFDSIYEECLSHGFRFDYIPRIMRDFSAVPVEDVMKSIAFMLPPLPAEERRNVALRMREMTTADVYARAFYKSMQKAQMKINRLVVINIGVSMTPYCCVDGVVKYYKEMLCLPIKTSVQQTIKDFLSLYKKYNPECHAVKEQVNRFITFEFYKEFFDFLLTPPPVEPDLIFLGKEPKSGKYTVSFRFGTTEKRVVLSPKEYNAFLEIVKKTFYGNSKGMPIGLDRTILAPVVSHLRQKITAAFPELSLAERYKPERDGNVYTIRLENTKVFIRQYISLSEYKDVRL